MLRPEYLFIWILFHLAAVELPKSISKRGQPDLRATELVNQMQYQRAVESYRSVKKVKSAAELRSLAYAFTQLGKNDTALALYAMLNRRYPQKVTPTDELNVALLHRRNGNYYLADSIISQQKVQSFAGYPILNQVGQLFLDESALLNSKISNPITKRFKFSNETLSPVKDLSTGDWYYTERRRVSAGLMSSVDLSDGEPFEKMVKANNWNDTIVSGTLWNKQGLNRHIELTYIDSFGNRYITTNHRLVNDSDRFLLDVFRYFKNPKVGSYTMESLSDQLWQHNTSGFVMNESQNKGIYCSDMMGGLGKADLYVCDIEWTGLKPKLTNYYNLGEAVNTTMSESDPCFVTDNIVAFSTEGHVGYGGRDIYFFDLNTQKLINAGNKINSAGHEYGIKFYDGVLYWTVDNYKGSKEMKFLTLNPSILQWAFDKLSGVNEIEEPVEVEEEIISDAREKELDPQDNVNFWERLDIDEGLKFLLLPDSLRLSISENLVDTALYSNYRLQNLLYPEDGLICDSKFEVELKIVINILKQRPNWVVDIRSYTDSRGSADFNQKLSQERANLLRDYFLFYGVKKNQIDAKGFGETFLLNHCLDGVACSEDEHKRNRRTTMHFKKRKDS